MLKRIVLATLSFLIMISAIWTMIGVVFLLQGGGSMQNIVIGGLGILIGSVLYKKLS